jgi:hypothetical protein
VTWRRPSILAPTVRPVTQRGPNRLDHWPGALWLGELTRPTDVAGDEADRALAAYSPGSTTAGSSFTCSLSICIAFLDDDLVRDPFDGHVRIVEGDRARAIPADPQTWTIDRPEGFVCLAPADRAAWRDFRPLWLDAVAPSE